MEVDEFEQFFASIWPRLLRSALRRLGWDEAHEVASATMLTVWTKGLPAPRDGDEYLRLVGLGFRILEGHIRNLRRSLARRERLLAQLHALQAVRPTAEPDACEALLSRDDALAVRALLSILSTAEREVVELVVAGYRVGEIANLLELAPGTVSSRLSRARKTLAESLDHR
ncbi:sigma-70 family RNA polymerase sigma factor [Nocardioides dubius]|uniref:HTH luxR-type domain-containing protein n=1 Tax=Nocardioides dubius TaxID=317019 RepID=A0ABN1TU50_9ACTN